MVLAPPHHAWASRHRVELRPNLPRQTLQPAAAASHWADAPVLSGVDFSAVAPPDVRLRVIEDEPYVYALAAPGRPQAVAESLTSLVLRADTPAVDGVPLGWYEVRIALRMRHEKGVNGPLALAFDAAADDAYKRAALYKEQRGDVVYGIGEVRSPLGLTDDRDCTNRWREYLAYSATAVNPNSAEGQARRTPYQYLRGELRVLRLVEKRECLLTLEFEAAEFPQALTLTENIARCVLNHLLAPGKAEQALPYLAYYPESERAALAKDAVLDPRVADLAERPGEGCGVGAQDVQGASPQRCEGQGPFWPARPYADSLYIHVLGAQIADTACSHCQLQPATPADSKPDLASGTTACGQASGEAYSPAGWFGEGVPDS